MFILDSYKCNAQLFFLMNFFSIYVLQYLNCNIIKLNNYRHIQKTKCKGKNCPTFRKSLDSKAFRHLVYVLYRTWNENLGVLNRFLLTVRFWNLQDQNQIFKIPFFNTITLMEYITAHIFFQILHHIVYSRIHVLKIILYNIYYPQEYFVYF